MQKVNIPPFNVAIVCESLNQQELSELSSSDEICVRCFDKKQEFLDYLESDSVNLIIINSLKIEREIGDLCNKIRNKSDCASIPIVLNVDKISAVEEIIPSLSFGINFFNSDTINLGLIQHYVETYFEKIVDSQNPSSICYQFKYNQYDLKIEPERVLTLLLSSLESYIRSKELINTYIGIAAHDIRNPLSVVLNATQLFLEKFGGALPAEGNQLLNMVISSSKNILLLLEEMLDISKLDSAKIELRTSEVDFQELIQECYAINKALAIAQEIQMTLEIDKNLPKITCDEFKIKQVITNLLTNAIKFSKSNTTIKIVVLTKDEKLYISIEDQGLGIAVDDFSKIFHEFGFTKTSSVHGETSTGLGLAIAKKIMSLHGGDISFTSKENEGSTFTIMLPLNPILK